MKLTEQQLIDLREIIDDGIETEAQEPDWDAGIPGSSLGFITDKGMDEVEKFLVKL